MSARELAEARFADLQRKYNEQKRELEGAKRDLQNTAANAAEANDLVKRLEEDNSKAKRTQTLEEEGRFAAQLTDMKQQNRHLNS